ncbi:DUF4259 domain-containing protein [Dactylosporangium darangshiense]|uniref:DUF4259 domain-containing protein n=1 Tax=Dactylosporangium darangshiense TaxID=579108 RepID=A0ABP8DJC4_9ACTN
MGSWGVGPFDEDTAADFADGLDDVALEEREPIVRGALERAVRAVGPLGYSAASEALAAAAIVVAQCPGGAPVPANYGPREPIPQLPYELRGLALVAIDRVLDPASELAEAWDETEHARRWRQGVGRLRDVLDPPVSAGQGSLFEL